jgi:hypothetical protein
MTVNVNCKLKEINNDTEEAKTRQINVKKTSSKIAAQI